MNIFLFDIDGVLVDGEGYFAALDATLLYLLRRLGCQEAGGLLPTREEWAYFEAQGITSQWDMAPLGLAAILEAACARLDLNAPPSLAAAEASSLLNNPALHGLQVDYPGLARRTAAELTPHADGVGEFAALAALRLARRRSPGEEYQAPLFPHLQQGNLLEELLGDSRSPWFSPTMRIFQNYVLGDRVFGETYHLEPQVETPSFLQIHDHPQISDTTLRRLKDLQQQGRIRLAVFSLRPSLPPPPVSQPNGYTPESELALQIMGLEKTPLVGFGHIQQLAQSSGQPIKSLQKPAPLQALAAILAGISGDERLALGTALQLVEDRQPAELLSQVLAAAGFTDHAAVQVHVFEDSAGGIRSAQGARQILEQRGLEVRLHAWGISSNPHKAAALRQAGACVFPDTSSALEAAYRAL
jgi:hypothetical protein